MSMEYGELTALIGEKGFDGAALVSAEPFFAIDPRELLPEARSVLVLFARYPVTLEPPPAGMIRVSGYYPASNRAYRHAKALAAELRERGVPALHSTELPAREAAGRAGGAFGRNGFYYHPEFGSQTHIQTVITAMEPEDGAPPAELMERCASCGACARVCPMGAVEGDISRCLRDALNTAPVPEEAAKHVYQLFGCERCQAVCPVNRAAGQRGADICLPAEELLTGDMRELKELVGPNIARRRRVLAQLDCLIGGHRQEL